MKQLQPAVLVVAAGLVFGLIGCSKESVVTSVVTDSQALQAAVTSIDSIAAFSSSDEATIDDNGLRSPEYDGFAKISGDTATPVRWGRHIFWSQVTRRYDVVIPAGDSTAFVTITKTLPGEFWVGVGSRTPDTVIVARTIKKPFTEVLTRNVRFVRVAHSDNPIRNWLPVAITMVDGRTRPDSLNHFSIASLEVEQFGHFDTTYTDPLQTWFRLGLLHGSIPHVRAGDSVRVRVTVNSSEGSAEIAHLRFGIAGNGAEHRRALMRLVSTTGGPGNFTRVFERTFIARLPRILPAGVLAARFNSVVDVLSYGSIYRDDAPFTNEFWGAPYIVVR